MLAAVAISLTIGDNGLLSKAIQAKIETELAKQREEQNLNELYGSLLVSDDGSITMTVEQFKNYTTPTGTIISYMGNNAPTGYVFCDGTIYNINDGKYKNLAEQIKSEFGSYNYFGGDGTTTFAVPDLRGEFLRGTGTNSHANQGNGENVGVHKDGTEIPYISYNTSAENKISISAPVDGNNKPLNEDSLNNTIPKETNSHTLKIPDQTNLLSSNYARNIRYTSRPTNTSVMYCIKY